MPVSQSCVNSTNISSTVRGKPYLMKSNTLKSLVPVSGSLLMAKTIALFGVPTTRTLAKEEAKETINPTFQTDATDVVIRDVFFHGNPGPQFRGDSQQVNGFQRLAGGLKFGLARGGADEVASAKLIISGATQEPLAGRLWDSPLPTAMGKATPHELDSTAGRTPKRPRSYVPENQVGYVPHRNAAGAPSDRGNRSASICGLRRPRKEERISFRRQVMLQ